MDIPLKTPTTPGGALLSHVQREIRNSLPPGRRAELASFIRRNCRDLTARLDEWILADALEHSRAAVPDDLLFGRADIKDKLVPLLGNYWAMDALVRRATERGPESRNDVLRRIERLRYGGHYRTDGETGAIMAILGTPWSDWEPPLYSRATPVDTKTAEGRATLDRRLLVALRRDPVRAVPSLHREVGGTKSQVRTALKRLTKRGRVWSHTLRGHKTSQEALQRDVTLWDLSDLRTELAPSAFDDIVVAELGRRPVARPSLTVTQLWREVGGSALDVRASLDRLGDRVSPYAQGRNKYWSLSVMEMLAPPGLRAIYEALKWDFKNTMKVKKVLEVNVPDSWRGHRIKERAVKQALYEVLGDIETVERIFKIVKEESDF